MCSVIERKVDLLLNESNMQFAYRRSSRPLCTILELSPLLSFGRPERAPPQHTAVGIKQLLHLSKPIPLRISSSGCHSCTAGHACECIKVTLRVFHADSTGTEDGLCTKVLPRFVQSMPTSLCYYFTDISAQDRSYETNVCRCGAAFHHTSCLQRSPQHRASASLESPWHQLCIAPAFPWHSSDCT